jgi:hypothetical protein
VLIFRKAQFTPLLGIVILSTWNLVRHEDFEETSLKRGIHEHQISLMGPSGASNYRVPNSSNSGIRHASDYRGGCSKKGI